MTIAYHIADCLHQRIRLYFPFIWPYFDYLTLLLTSLVRLCSGFSVAKGVENCSRPLKPLELYQFDGCPYCRQVRETLSCLDLDYVCYPCPRETFKQRGVCLNSRFRPIVKQKGGVCMFPFLIDPSKEVKLYHTDEIIKYLWATYGDKATPGFFYLLAFQKLYKPISLRLTLFLRPCLDMGYFRAASRNVEKNLKIWGYEGNPRVRKVLETLSTLELPYEMCTMAVGSTLKRKEFQKEHDASLNAILKNIGFCNLPYLEDPNTHTRLWGGTAIVDYLKKQYQTAPVPAESWLDVAH